MEKKKTPDKKHFRDQDKIANCKWHRRTEEKRFNTKKLSKKKDDFIILVDTRLKSESLKKSQKHLDRECTQFK